MIKQVFAASLCLVLCNALADPSPSPTPPVGQLHEDYFVPTAGYIGTVRRDQLNRLKTSQKLARGAPPIGGLTVERSLPVICVNFHNVPPPFATSDYEKLLFDTAADSKSVTQYYADMSNKKLKITGKVKGWYALPEDDSYYENNEQGSGEPFGKMLQAALEKADAEIDFGDFDNDGGDGAANSGDDDGKVDTLVIIQSDSGGECNDATSPHIRSRSAHYSDEAFGHSGKPFVTRSIRRDLNLKPKLGPDGPEHITINDFIIVPAVTCGQSNAPQTILQIGVLCHEYGHALGLPDLYDRNQVSYGAGNWCLMAYGCYGGDHQHPDTPTSMSAWCKQYLGWATVQKVASSGELQLEAVEDRNLVYRFDVPDTDEKEYFLVEYRNRSWKDVAGTRINWDRDLPGSGLAVWHIDERVGKQISTPSPTPNPDWPMAPPDQGQNDAPTLPNGRNTGYRTAHSLVALVEADGHFDLAKRRNFGTDTDLFTTGASFEDDSNFARGSRAYNGRKTGIAITAINLTDYTALAQSSIATSQPIVESGNPEPSPEQSPPETGESPAESNATLALKPSSTVARIRSAAPPMPTLPKASVEASAVPASPAAPETNVSVVRQIAAAASVAPERATSLKNVNQVLNAASITLNEFPSAGADKKTLVPKLNEALERQGLGKISEADLKNIAKAQPSEIRKEIEADHRAIVQALGAEARTKDISPSTSPTTAAESDVVNLIRQSKQQASVQIQSSPEGTRLERVTNLSVPVTNNNVATDAETRVKQDLKKAIGDDVKLQAKEDPKSESPNGQIVRFEQVVRSGGKSLPVFGKEAALYYSTTGEPTFTGVTNGTVSAKALKVTGSPGTLGTGEAERLVAKQLKLDPNEVGTGSEGVYLVGDNPKTARIAVQVPVHVDEHHPDIKVFVDSETREILEIK